jgi:hypothetical protein
MPIGRLFTDEVVAREQRSAAPPLSAGTITACGRPLRARKPMRSRAAP